MKFEEFSVDGRSHGVTERRTDGRTRTDRRTEGTVLSYGPTPSDGACHCVDRRCCEAELLPAGSWGRRGAGRPPAGAPASHWSEAHLAQCQYGPGPGDAGTAGWTPRTARSSRHRSRISGHPRSAETALLRLAAAALRVATVDSTKYPTRCICCDARRPR